VLTYVPRYSGTESSTSLGSVCYTIFCEIPATQVRTKTIAVATAAQDLVAIVMTVVMPYIINPDQTNIRGKWGLFGDFVVPGN